MVGVDQRVDDGVEVAVEHLAEVVGLVAHPVVGDPVLREVVRADPLAAVDGADLAAAGVAVLRGLLVRASASSRERSTRSADSRFCSWLFSFCSDTVTPVGRWVIRTAESVVLTLCPPGPQERKTSMRRSFGSICTSTSSASGSTRTPAALVWMRPWLSVTGTRCTRCTPPSYFSRPYTGLPGSRLRTASEMSLYPPSSASAASSSSVVQPCRSA